MPPELVPPALVVTVRAPAPEVALRCLTVPPPPALGDPAEGERPPPPTLVALAAGPGYQIQNCEIFVLLNGKFVNLPWSLEVWLENNVI